MNLPTKSYPSATVCRTRGVRFIIIEGYDFVKTQWFDGEFFMPSFLSLSNVQPTAVGEHAPHPFQGAIPKPLHPHVGADYLCQEDADSRQFHLPQAHVQSHAEADAIVEDAENAVNLASTMKYCKNLATLSASAVGIAACSSPDRNVHSANSGRLARQMPSKANPLREGVQNDEPLLLRGRLQYHRPFHTFIFHLLPLQHFCHRLQHLDVQLAAVGKHVPDAVF